MDIDTAIKLKEAGYNHFGFRFSKYFKDGESFLVPSLSELIDAIGDDFNFVCRNRETGLWGAESHSGHVFSKEKSAEEAVALLWLSINKK